MRYELNLDREWRFRFGDGETTALKSHSDSYGSCKAGHEFGIPSMDYDDSAWRLVNVPHDYMTETAFGEENLLSHGYKTRGNAWYRKTFRLPEDYAGKHLFLSFEGMAVTAAVYFNGSLIGRSFSAYAPLDIDITDRAFFGDRSNVLAVRIDGLTTEGWWYEGSGIYRHVKLYVKEPVHIAHDSIFIKPALIPGTANDWNVSCSVSAENSFYTPAAVQLRTELFDGESCIASGTSDPVTCGADEKVKVSCRLSVNDPHRWDVDDPKLYIARVTLLHNGEPIDEDFVRFGFRTFRADKEKGFFLNEKPIKLKGTCNHQDHAGVGVAVPDSVQYYRIRRLKEMGTNAYRCAHNMPAKEILDACDELGMLVMDENRRFESRPEVIGHVEAMVRRDRNHPSVVLYSLFNEEPMQGTKEGGNIFRRMKQAVLRLDDTRLITGAMNGGYNDPNGAAMFMDVTGINYAVPKGVLDYHDLYPDQCVFGSENNSAISTRGCYKTDADAHVLACYDEDVVPWGQLIKTTWKFTREHDWFGGICIWTGFDYRGEPTPYQWPSIGSQFGIMDTCGFPKDSFYQNRACFVSEPMVHILPHWNHDPGETVRVMTASNCEEVELFLNGVTLGRKPSDCCEPAEWQVTYEPGTLSAVGYVNGKPAAEAKNITSSKPARIIAEADRLVILNDGADTVPVNFSVADENGVICETASDLLHFTVTGDGVLLGVGNGDPNCLESDHEPQRSLFAGHAQALIQSLPGAKEISLHVTGEGLIPADVTFRVADVPAPLYIYESASRTLTGVTVSASTYAEKPDACMVIADNDMNSFEPVSFERDRVKPGHTEGFRLFRAFVKTPERTAEEVNVTLNVPSLTAKAAWLYADGRLVSEIGEVTDAPLRLTIPCTPGKTCELRLLVEALPGNASGIRGAVGYRVD